MDRKSIAKSLEIVLAETYSLYIKTQNYHWNVNGANFRDLHKLFESQYKDLGKAIDKIAERIRAVGSITVSSFDTFQKMATLGKPISSSSAEVMVQDLLDDQNTLVRALNNAIKVARKSEDEATITLLADRILKHEENRWMLAATLGNSVQELSRIA